MRTHPHPQSTGLAVAVTLGLATGCSGGAERPAAGVPAPAPAAGYVIDIEQATLANEDYRRVLYTGEHTQLVLMTLQPGEEIDQETHEGLDQFIRVEAGTGRLLLNGVEHRLEDGSAVVIPAGAEHTITSVGEEPLRLYSLYSPPQHPPGTVQRTKAEAEAAEEGHGDAP